MQRTDVSMAFGRPWRWLRRAWMGTVLLILIGMAVWAWMARPLAPWTQGWVSWWSGDDGESRPLWNWKVNLGNGVEIVDADGDAAYRHRYISGLTQLGYWRERSPGWSWAEWVWIATPDGRWSTNRVELAAADVPGVYAWMLGISGGRPYATLDVPGGNWPDPSLRCSLNASMTLEQRTWTHLAFSSEGNLARLYVNGQIVAEEPSRRHASAHLARFCLTAGSLGPVEVLHDDVVLWDRTLGSAEIASLAARGRGAWTHEIRRARTAVSMGRGVLLGSGWLIGLLLFLTVALWVAERFGILAEELPRPIYRPVLGVLAAGVLLSLTLGAVAHVRGRRHDAAQFHELLKRMEMESDAYWERLAAFLFRMRDWASAQSDLTPEAWKEWLVSNHYPHEFSGVVGVGYAQQVQPSQLAVHEAEWSTKHRYPYAVHPKANGRPHVGLNELEGDPRLPVVLFEPKGLDEVLWRTNHSILGRDLLFIDMDERRAWAEPFRVRDAVARNEVTSSSVEEIAPAGWYGTPVRGLRLYVPWAMRTKLNPLETLKPGEWRGVFFISVDLRRLLEERYGSGAPEFGFRMYTGAGAINRFELAADTSEVNPDTAERPDAYLRETFSMGFYHYRLFIDAWSTPAFEAQATRRWSWWLAGGGLAVTGLVTALLFVEVRARDQQGRVLEALRAANSELLLTYRERESLSRDLHDGSIQNLYALGLHLQRVQKLLDSAPGKAREELGGSLEMLDHSIAELRQFILTARIDQLDRRTTAQALGALMDRLRKTTTVELKLQVDPQADLLQPGAGVQLLQIVREAVSNSLRHGHPRTVEVRLEPLPNSKPSASSTPAVAGTPPGEPQLRWRLIVRDDGRGFDPRQVHGSGRGLRNLHARAQELGGQLDVQAAPESGACITIEFEA